MLIIVNFKSLTRKPSYGSFFSAWNTDFKNVIFEKKNWAPSEVIEVKRSFSRPNFVFHLVFTSFYLELSAFCVWPQQPRRPQKGLREFFQNLHFWNQCVPRKKVRCVAGSWSQFSLNLSTEEVWSVTKFDIRFFSTTWIGHKRLFLPFSSYFHIHC